MHPFVKLIGDAVKKAGYTTVNAAEKPKVAIHLAGKVAGIKDLEPQLVRFNEALMENIGTFLTSKGVSMEAGVSVLKAEAASDALVLNAQSESGRELIIKMVTQTAPFARHPDFNDPILQEAIMHTVPSALNKSETVLVRIEPKGLPVDKAVAHLPADQQAEISRMFKQRIHSDLKARGLGGNDVKMNNFVLPPGSKPNSLEEIMALEPKLIDVDTLVIPPGSSYTPKPHSNPPGHADDLFKPAELPRLSAAQKVPATSAAMGVSQSVKHT